MKLEGESITQGTIKVEGMSCGHCEMRVKKAIEAIEGIRKVEVNLRNKNVVVEYDERKANFEKIKAAIKEVGYEPG